MRCTGSFTVLKKVALVTQRDEAIAVLRDEACTSWASMWLAFQRRATRAFPSLDPNFQVPSEGEGEESSSESEADPRTFSDAPRSADCPRTLRFQLKPAPLPCMWELCLLFTAIRPMFELSCVLFICFS